MHITLWIVQLLLASILLWSGSTKLLQPIEKVAAMWPWVGEVPTTLVTFTGLVDLLAAAGLVLPSLLSIQPRLTAIAAAGVVVLMVVASVFHIARGEVASIGVNVAFALLAAFVVWGRLKSVTPGSA